MEIGDKVVLVSHEDEGRFEQKIQLNTVGTVIKEPYPGGNSTFQGMLVPVSFDGSVVKPWVKNLRPAKDYYIKQFKRVYEGS